MFKKGEYVVAGNNGICEVSEITHLCMSGANKERLYYVLLPIDATDRKVYSPVDNSKVVMRSVLTREEAEELIDEIVSIDKLEEKQEGFREDEYKEIMKTCDCKQWVRIIKTLYSRKQDRISNGKKATVTDEKYLKQAEDKLYSELAFAIGKEKSEMVEYIGNRIANKV